ncbi:regulatory inactivation of DnaA Hda protein [Psychromonas ingrahamii 37]|uniref:Regulatory inactivation of DnaA Hda protein n=1 Tax=Psychromonas ingrahamii (strain DSM 17664 / CCUG 51855 / 37) TaxID=357804 RepID=A1STU5_PSYIN|nr:DnaA inactivator Hda [Psychromonas ingrahamii]ABM02910.1 regulatory inactivation of DnaA Hda protein [Psychromonas ingrahamii 37]
MPQDELRFQYPLLALKFPDDETFASFYPGQNYSVLTQLKNSVVGLGEPVLYMWGESGSGRSHLLHALCSEVDERGDSVAYIPLRHYQSMTLDIFENMEQVTLVCIDDIEEIAGDEKWEKALFDFYNRWSDNKENRSSGASLVFCANHLPKQLGLKLNDLVSRLEWGACYHLTPLNEEDKLGALQLRAQLKGMKLPVDVGRFLLNRLSRDMNTLLDTLDQLDNASLEAKRKLTIPFVKEVLVL